jgi:hypothetical protein
MERMIQLNLRSDSENAAANNLPNSPKEPETPVVHSKRLNRMLKKVGHHQATASQGKSGIFTK